MVNSTRKLLGLLPGERCFDAEALAQFCERITGKPVTLEEIAAAQLRLDAARAKAAVARERPKH
jgi:hypothetical protein